MTYGQLIDAIDAASEQHRSLPSGAVIAVPGPLTATTVVRLLATMASGQVILPLDLALPDERRRAMIAQAGAVAIHDTATAALTMVEPGPRSGLVAGLGTDSRHPAYVFFTSGSTGAPKAIVGTSEGLSQFLCWQRDTFRVGATDRVAAITGLSFDPVLRALFLGLVSGARLCLPDPTASPSDQLDWIRAVGATIVHATPSQLRLWLTDGTPGTLPDLRITFTAGEPLTAGLVAAWRERAHSSRIVNLYGPTETTLARCWHELDASNATDPIPVGTAIAGSVVEVLDNDGAPCPVGVAGDVWIRTWFGTLGYLDAPADSGFRPDPERPDLVTYRTGDTGRLDAHGDLVLIGRSDDQVKIAGVRVEPGEVARTLERHDAVASAMVLPFDHNGSTALGGFVVPTPGCTIDTGELRRFAARTLPAAALPGRIIVIDALPLTANGKVDRQRLRDLVADRSDGNSSGLSTAEQQMAAIWTDVLGREVDTPTADFWDLGGSSLAALRVKSRMGGGIDFAGVLHHLLEHPTLRDFTRTVNGFDAVESVAIQQTPSEEAPIRVAARPQRPVVSVDSEPVGESHPLSPQQRQMWLLDSLGAGSNYYAMQRVLITGSVDERALERAFGAVIEAHDILRARVRLVGDEPVVVYAESTPFQLEVVDHPIGADDDPLIWAEQLGDEFRDEQSMSLEHGPVFQVRLYELRNGHQLLFVKIHHFCTDGFSMPPMWEAVSDAYAAAVSGRPVQLPRPPRQYHEWAAENRAALESGQLDDALAWWEEQLRDAPTLQLPNRSRQAGERRYEQKRLKLRFPESFKAQLRAAADEIGVTRNQILLSLYALCLERLTGQDDVVIGMPANARTTDGDKQVIGYFVNLLPLRIRIPEERSLRAVALRAAAVADVASRHRSVPFEAIVDRVKQERRPGVPALAQTEFNYRQHHQTTPRLEGVETRYLTFGAAGTAFDIAMHVSTAATALITLSWESDALATHEARCALDEFEAITLAALADVDRDLRDVHSARPHEPSMLTARRRMGYAALSGDAVKIVGVLDNDETLHTTGLGELVVDDDLPTAMLAVVADGHARLLGPVDGMAVLNDELVDIAELRGRISALTEVEQVEVREIAGRLTAIVVPHHDSVDPAALEQRITDLVGANLPVVIAAELPLVRSLASASAVHS